MKGKELLLHMGFIPKDFSSVKLFSNKVPSSPADIRELKHARFWDSEWRQPEENISRARTVLSPRFLYY